MQCTIEGKILSLAGVSGHLYLEAFDENGVRICQINGLATNPRTGKIKSVGSPGDKIRAYISSYDGVVLGASRRCNRDNHCHKGCVLFSGTRAEIEKAIEAMRHRAAEINAAQAPYKLLSLNSNTVFSEMVSAAETVIPVDRKALGALLKSKAALPGASTDFNKAVSALKKPSRPKPPRP